jgi:hypothetical protein
MLRSIACEPDEDSQAVIAYGGFRGLEMEYMDAVRSGRIEYVMRVISAHSRGNTAHLGRIIPPVTSPPFPPFPISTFISRSWTRILGTVNGA